MRRNGEETGVRRVTEEVIWRRRLAVGGESKLCDLLGRGIGGGSEEADEHKVVSFSYRLCTSERENIMIGDMQYGVLSERRIGVKTQSRKGNNMARNSSGLARLKILDRGIRSRKGLRLP